jgi:cold shock CspA family protein
MIGRINWYSPLKKYGFVTLENDGKDQPKEYFFHRSDIISQGELSELKKNDRVQFDLGERNGRVKAINVNVVVNGG